MSVTPAQIAAIKILNDGGSIYDAVDAAVAAVHAPRFTAKQKEWLARVLATNLASGPSDKTYQVDIDDWIAKVGRAFEMVENMKPEDL